MGTASTREQIVEAADRLFYRRGYDHTSFADIAGAVGISRGNFYHHFRTKDAILAAVIEARLAERREMLAAWEREHDDPAARIRCYIDIPIRNRALIKRFGCPVGTLCTELGRLDHASRAEASAIFTLFRRWLRGQFEALGRERDADADAMHLLARSQGIAVMASAYRDEKFIRHEVALLHAWLDDCTRNDARQSTRKSSQKTSRRR